MEYVLWGIYVVGAWFGIFSFVTYFVSGIKLEAFIRASVMALVFFVAAATLKYLFL